MVKPAAALLFIRATSPRRKISVSSAPRLQSENWAGKANSPNRFLDYCGHFSIIYCAVKLLQDHPINITFARLWLCATSRTADSFDWRWKCYFAACFVVILFSVQLTHWLKMTKPVVRLNVSVKHTSQDQTALHVLNLWLFCYRIFALHSAPLQSAVHTSSLNVCWCCF